MRVIAGKARRVKLIAPEGHHVRPTTDRIKETLFNIINPYIIESNFLDLFSGSGAIGIEALSRGAHKAVFVENNRNALESIRINLNNTKLGDNCQIYTLDAINSVEILERDGHVFDVIFMDPPYNTGIEEKILEKLKASTIINQDTIIIIESDINDDLSYIDKLGFSIEKIKKYKTNQHVFIYG
ncbi:16S rRNA (guanine(966)-N(2))-methyltransferase RsmD [Natranaerovirga pectinivora]|uniref:16S rRNA (Guanine(966)-N(2))-methyltransferase RsmD n=1 Tax=Natranaerovirga pectinivora TaxID=682400 RepID=A0A4R3MRX5_9FIRM|nr:16S rRNA (guanine(966)-N(2))-methyltransferase RsmD [Natranaerovirga pectinivora]TCT16958.1 16S rRNA (guanine(966)-N(2))-methyltransferase RsmD [Natranaerovirga pectinivora]